MPICTSCGKWTPAGEARAPCPTCGGVIALSERLRQVLAAADAEGLTFEEFQQRREAERAEAEAARSAPLIEAARAREEAAKGQPPHWSHERGFDDGQGEGMFWTLFIAPATVILGVILLVVFLLLGLPFWIPVAATVIGLVGGLLLAATLSDAVWHLFDRLSYRAGWIDRHGASTYGFVSLALTILGSPVLTLVVALVLVAIF